MPIIGLTAGLEAEMPRLGQLRKGEAKPKDSKRPGKDLDYLRFVCEDPAIVKRFHDIYGTEPRLIHVHLPFPDAARNFPTWREEHGKGSLKHRCDGRTMILWQDNEGLYHTTPEPCPYADLPDNDPGRKCKQRGLLRVFIDELGEWGYVDVVTGGKWDCIGLTQNVLEVENMARLASAITGRPIGVQGIPCHLKREKRMTSCPPLDGKGPRVRLEKWMLYLYVAPGYIQRLMEEMQRYSLPVVDLPQLDAPASDLDVDYYVANGDDDVERPETEILDEPEPTEGPQATNGRKAERPLEPEQLREFLHKRAGDGKTLATQKQVPFVASKFTEAFAPDEDATQEYHSALQWLWEVDSAKALTKGQAKATLDWLLDPNGADDSGDTPLHQHASEEARRVLRLALQEAGQQELPL